MTESLESIIGDICQQLPECYIINLCMEHGAAWVTLSMKNVGFIELPDSADKTLVEQLRDAVICAHAHAFGEAPTDVVITAGGKETEAEILTRVLGELRGLRDSHFFSSKERQHYNCICDSLDDLENKILRKKHE